MKGTREAYFPETGFVRCTVYDRYALAPGARHRGPAIVEEREATVVVGPDAGFTIDEYLNLVMEIDAAAGAAPEADEARAARTAASIGRT